jgi:hypothetical protein
MHVLMAVWDESESFLEADNKLTPQLYEPPDMMRLLQGGRTVVSTSGSKGRSIVGRASFS